MIFLTQFGVFLWKQVAKGQEARSPLRGRRRPVQKEDGVPTAYVMARGGGSGGPGERVSEGYSKGQQPGSRAGFRQPLEEFQEFQSQLGPGMRRTPVAPLDARTQDGNPQNMKA